MAALYPPEMNTLHFQGMTVTIQPTPNRSATIPKRADQNVLASGICTCPPSASAANFRSASASFATVSEREKPWKSA